MSGTRRPRFWIFLILVVLAVSAGAIRLLITFNRSPSPAITGLAIALILFAAITGGFALSISARMRHLRETLPAAIHIPIVVDAVLAAATADLSARTGLTGIQLKSSSYASVAIDAEGLHVVSNRNEPTGLVPASTLEVAGLSRATLGTREVTSLVLRATTPTGTVDLPLVPMRLHGNPLRFLTPAEFDALSARVAAALRGERIEEPGWAF